MKNFFIIIAIIALASCVSTAKATTCRNAAVKRTFDKQEGYPNGRKGYVVDHVCALVQGGLDSTINMQYQTIDEGHKKDKIENSLIGRAEFCTPLNSTPTRQVFNCK